MKYVVLENIRSAHNVGAIFRTADGAGVDKIFLVGYTPRPIDRFGRTRKEIQKTSLGASEYIPWEYVETTDQLQDFLKTNQVTLVAVEQSSVSVPLGEFTEPSNVAYVMGNEVTGVEDSTLELADVIVELPMLGQKESLNVSVTAGIILYHGVV